MQIDHKGKIRANCRLLSTRPGLLDPRKLLSESCFRAILPALKNFTGEQLLKFTQKDFNSIFQGLEFVEERAVATLFFKLLHPMHDATPGSCCSPWCLYVHIRIFFILVCSGSPLIVPSCVAVPVSVRINMGDEDTPNWLTKTFDMQTDLKEFLHRLGAGGLRNGDFNLVDKIINLKDGSKYTIEFANTSVFSRLKTQVDDSIGFVANRAKAFEHKVRMLFVSVFVVDDPHFPTGQPGFGGAAQSRYSQ